MVGMGEKYDATKLTALPPGAFGTVPKEMRHFALSKTATVVQVHGAGPFKVNWVNPAEAQPPDTKPAAAKKAGRAKIVVFLPADRARLYYSERSSATNLL